MIWAGAGIKQEGKATDLHVAAWGILWVPEYN
jgi:hypothetical protein